MPRKQIPKRRKTDAKSWKPIMPVSSAKELDATYNRKKYPSLPEAKVRRLVRITTNRHLNSPERHILLIKEYETGLKLVKTDRERERLQAAIRYHSRKLEILQPRDGLRDFARRSPFTKRT